MKAVVPPCAFLRLHVMRSLSTAPLADSTRNQLPGYHARGVMRHSRFADSAKIEKDFFRPQFAAKREQHRLTQTRGEPPREQRHPHPHRRN